ncbi:hypothetical protein SAMN04488118_104289 [Epibacterium ulvae]|uniref:Type III secretion protein C n=2 Tax=Alphaproteobacteria TaxID=28211 RepID=A0A1G5QIW4_9RHOB|nr:hypothetical protein [Epibacterium ulvae]AGI04145.1 putative type III secretion protein YscC [alpha proteobacterium U95]SCZ61773.1 hypothetical protein SAMN04488118_104289 [Epibacterium ulvae]
MNKLKNLLLTIFASFCVVESWAWAQTNLESPIDETPYPFTTQRSSLDTILDFYTRNLRIGLAVEEGISGDLEGGLTTPLSRIEFLDFLANEFDFVWYFDGAQLNISPQTDVETRIYSLSDFSGSETIRMLKALGIFQDKFSHRYDERSRTFLALGPTKYLDTVGNAIEAAENSERAKTGVIRGPSAGPNQAAPINLDRDGLENN